MTIDYIESVEESKKWENLVIEKLEYLQKSCDNRNERILKYRLEHTIHESTNNQ